MTKKSQFGDMIVVLPGIGGSTLRDAHGPLWEPSLGLAGSLLRNRHDVLTRLAGDRDQLDDPEHPGTVTATGLISTPVTVPGLSALNQYTPLRTQLTTIFDLVPGDPSVDGAPANYFEFPYDWRRDIRISSAVLKELVDRELPKWRSGHLGDGAKVVLICHSMGGLVAKYYLDVLGGWRHCRALITYGTPFRGSLKPLDLLANGLRRFGIGFDALSDVLRQFTSLYQMLPRYPVVQQDGQLVRVSELQQNIGGLDLNRARSAYEDFHRAMNTDRSSHAGRSLDHLITMRPIVGYGHRTAQSASIAPGLQVSPDLITDNVNQRMYSTGDGTVPSISALPIELSDHGPWWWENGKHSTMHTTANTLTSLVKTLSLGSARLGEMQGPDRGQKAEAPQEEVTIDVHADEVTPHDEPLLIDCAVSDPAVTEPPELTISGARAVHRSETGEGYRYVVHGLAVGAHEFTVTWAGRSVTDVVEVC